MQFDRFRLLPSRRHLLREGERMPLGARAFDLLLALIEQRHRVLTKDELLDQVWHGVVVEENSLQVQVSAIRKVLGRDAIATVPGRGYQFVLPVNEDDCEQPPDRMTVASPALLESVGQSGHIGHSRGLPNLRNAFFGRQAELRAIFGRLVQGYRLLSLTGPGGCGKTRLAVEATRSIAVGYRDGVFWIDLAPLRDAANVLPTIALAVGAGLELEAWLKGREILLVLDNLEQVVEAAPALSGLLTRCPELIMIATSREALRVQWEIEITVPPLLDGEAVELFCDRARMPISSPIGELCVRLDNMPLALELAAARMKAASVEQLLDRLTARLDMFTGKRDADPRHRSLRATVDWSFQMLPEDERQLFTRLAVFNGGWTLEAAEQVAGATVGSLQSLLEKNLICRDGSRYSMLQTLWQYAAERLAASSGALDLRDGHTAFFFEYARKLSAAEAEPLRRRDSLRADMENFRAALAWLDGRGSTTSRLELAMFLFAVWLGGGFHTEGRRVLEDCLRKAQSVPQRLQGRAHRTLGDIAVDQGRYAEAETHLQIALDGLERVEGAQGCADTCIVELGMAAAYLGKDHEAAGYFRSAIERSRSDRASDVLVWALQNYGAFLIDRGDVLEGERACREALSLSPIADAEAGCLYILAFASLADGKLMEAYARFRRSLEIQSESGQLVGAADALGGIAAVLAELGRYEDAARLCGAVLIWKARSDTSLAPRERALHDKTASGARTALGESIYVQRVSEGKQLDWASATSIALRAQN